MTLIHHLSCVVTADKTRRYVAKLGNARLILFLSVWRNVDRLAVCLDADNRHSRAEIAAASKRAIKLCLVSRIIRPSTLIR